MQFADFASEYVVYPGIMPKILSFSPVFSILGVDADVRTGLTLGLMNYFSGFLKDFYNSRYFGYKPRNGS
jgi:hypothetical protein